MITSTAPKASPQNTEVASRNGVTPKKLDVPDYFDKTAIPTRLFGLILLLIFLPLMALIALLVRLTSPGPALFRQIRVGKDRKLFIVNKMRTMYIDAEDLSGPTWSRPGDSRVTPLGKVLRFLHLDELPQLINVVKGDMGLIGPRPERPEIIELQQLAREIPNYHDRHAILPGVTGLAQINLPADQSIDCVHNKLHLDIEYIQTANAWLDFRILLCTALRMLGVRHSRAAWLLGLCRSVRSKTEDAEQQVEANDPQHQPALAALGAVNGNSPVADSSGSCSGYPQVSTIDVDTELPEKRRTVSAELAHSRPR